MSIPAALLDDLRALARKHGGPALMQGMAELLAQFAVHGYEAQLAERRGDEAEPCPRCRTRAAWIREMEDVLKRTRTAHPQGGGTTNTEEG